MATKITSVSELVEALGGPTKAAKILSNRATPQKVVNWRAQGSMPARLFVAHHAILKEQGICASASLWGMAEAEGEAA